MYTLALKRNNRRKNSEQKEAPGSGLAWRILVFLTRLTFQRKVRNGVNVAEHISASFLTYTGSKGHTESVLLWLQQVFVLQDFSHHGPLKESSPSRLRCRSEWRESLLSIWSTSCFFFLLLLLSLLFVSFKATEKEICWILHNAEVRSSNNLKSKNDFKKEKKHNTLVMFKCKRKYEIQKCKKRKMLLCWFQV